MADGSSTVLAMAGSSLLANSTSEVWSKEPATDSPFEAGVLWGSADFSSEERFFLRAFSMALSLEVSPQE